MGNGDYETKNSSQNEVKGETISELARRHLLNKDHTTTDEELKNARIEFNENFNASSVEDLSALSDADNSTLLPPLPFEKKDGNSSNPSDSNTRDKSIPNPYDVLR